MGGAAGSGAWWTGLVGEIRADLTLPALLGVFWSISSADWSSWFRRPVMTNYDWWAYEKTEDGIAFRLPGEVLEPGHASFGSQ